ncbi:hypothetical protein BH11PSE3_BH11PSE3_20290 [soil metagenome]
MSALAISLVAGVIMLGGAVTGILLRRWLPDRHLNDHSKDVIRLGSGLIATISALVLGLLITSAKSSYDVQRNEIRQIAAKLVLLDNGLKRYGPESRPARELLRQSMDPMIDRIWSERTLHSPRREAFRPSDAADRVYSTVEALAPKTEGQHTLRGNALRTITDVTESRVLLFEQSGEGLPVALLGVLVFWLAILFASFTLFSPINPAGAVALAIIALSAAGAIFLILEMNAPFTGLMQISSAPLYNALGAIEP